MKKRLILLIAVMGLCIFTSCTSETTKKSESQATKEPLKMGETCVQRYKVLSEKEKTVIVTSVESPEDGKLVIPEEVDGYKVVQFGDDSDLDSSVDESMYNVPISGFKEGQNKVKEVVLPNTLETIGMYAFLGCENLEKITIPEKCRWIGKSAFKNCKSLYRIHIPKSCEKIGDYAFSKTGISDIKLLNKDVILGKGTFSGCKKLKRIEWPEEPMTGVIGDSCFGYCGLEELNYPNMEDGKSVRRFAFANNKKLKKVYFPKDKARILIPNNVFIDCKNTKLIIPKTVEEVEYQVSPYLQSIAIQGDKTKFVNLETLIVDGKDVSGKYYLHIRKVFAPKNSVAFKQVSKAYYGVENNSSEEAYCAEENNYNDCEMKPVQVVEFTDDNTK